MATWRVLPESRTQPALAPTQVILHSAVTSASSLYNYFASPTVNLESHFYVDAVGRVEQYIDTNVRADANLKANVRAISIETWDRRDPDHIPWTPDQQRAIVELLSWCHEVHGVPLHRAARWDSPGVGGHSDFPGIWTPVKGKTCPGLARRPQVDGLIARARKAFEQRDLTPGVRVLARGMRGDDVAVVQRAVGVSADGVFGAQTEAAVRAFQASQGLASDGLVGQGTWSRILRGDDVVENPNNVSDADVQRIAEAILHYPIPREGSSLGGVTTLANVIANWDRAQELARAAVADALQAPTTVEIPEQGARAASAAEPLDS